MTLYLLAITIVNLAAVAAGCASRVAPGLDLRESRRILRHCKLHTPGPAAASPRIYDPASGSPRTSPGASLPPSGRCGRGRHCRTGAACYQDTCAASPSGHSSACGSASHVLEMMSRAATLPGAAARSPRAAETDPHFTKLQPWRPRAGGTAPGERQRMQKPLQTSLQTQRRRAGARDHRSAAGGAAGACVAQDWCSGLALVRH